LSRYDFPVDAGNKKTVYSIIASWVEPGKRALDVGCDTGNLGAFMKGMGLSVDGIEMDPVAALSAKDKLDSVSVGSVEDPAVLDSLNGPYDYIIFADVLEHLSSPEATLERVKPLLKAGGHVIASLPNVANFRVRFGLLFGRFEYTEIGILDRTHLRFYTRKSGTELFRRAGYEPVGSRPAATYMPTPLLYGWPELFATRFVVKAKRP